MSRNRKVVAIEVKTGRRQTNEGLPKFKNMFHPHKAFVVGSGGISTEDFLTMDLEWLFK